MDTEVKMGNAIKLTMINLIEEDQRCFKTKGLDKRHNLRQKKWKLMTPELTGWDLFMPQ
jgi:hypothetical protein